jgi:hypothetical protein
MYVTIIYPYITQIDHEDYEFEPWSQYDYVRTYEAIGENHANDVRLINYYVFLLNGVEFSIPETHAVIEAEEREGKYKYPRYIYDKYTGKFDQPRDWIKDFISRIGNDIRQNMKVRHNGENIQIPKSRGSKASDSSESKDSGGETYKI